MAELDHAVSIVRTFATSPGELFRAWTDPERRKQWLVPPTYTLSICTSDPRVGGEWDLVLRDEQGAVHRDHGQYATLVDGQLIETSWFYSTSTRSGEDESWLSVTFRLLAPDRTEQVLIHSRLTTPAQRSGYLAGWEENMTRLSMVTDSPVAAN